MSAGNKDAKARKLTRSLEQVDRKGEKAATKITYKDEDGDLGITSIDPVNAVGSQAVVVYNTRSKHIEVYRAVAGSALSFQGARITNFDTAISMGRTLRKPESDLAHWTRATTIRRLEVLIDGIKGKKWEVTGKLNRNTMIIKVL